METFTVVLIGLIFSIVISLGYYFEAWILVDFRKKIGDKNFFMLLGLYVFLIALVAYILAK